MAAWLFLGFSQSVHTVLIGGIEFPQGEVSLADEVRSYDPVIAAGNPTAPHQEATNALGLPDYDGVNSCPSAADCSFVSLGSGGSLTLRFTDNLLTGSGNSDLDVWIFEVGPDVEDTFVEISKDGATWFSIGKVFGATAGIDIDAFGFGPTDAFAYIRLTDDPNEGQRSGHSVGADIDAVGAISTVLVSDTCNGQIATIVGTEDDDILIGTEGNDVIVGLKGDDIIYGLGGNDIICGGPGKDTLFGGDGNDRLFGEGSADVLFGGEGHDRLFGGDSRDILVGNAGNDRLSGNQGDDVLIDGSGTDTLKGGSGVDTCDGDVINSTLDECEVDSQNP